MTDITSSFNDIQKIIDILNVIKNKVNNQTDIVWSGYDSPQALINKLESEVKNLQSGNYQFIGDVSILFSPTGVLQEISISNGWGNEFLTLAEQFDHCYKKFKRDNFVTLSN